jgi:hypothetical protein
VVERRLNPLRLALNQVFQLIRDEAAEAKVTLDEVKNLVRYVKDKTNGNTDSAAFLGSTSNDEIEVNDLINAIVDA